MTPLDHKLPFHEQLSDEQRQSYVERYSWLKEGVSRQYNAPAVVDFKRSRLYAISRYLKEQLDLAIDHDIMLNVMEWMHVENYITENELNPQGLKWPTDEYGDLCFEVAGKYLGWSAERLEKLKAYEKLL